MKVDLEGRRSLLYSEVSRLERENHQLRVRLHFWMYAFFNLLVIFCVFIMWIFGVLNMIGVRLMTLEELVLRTTNTDPEAFDAAYEEQLERFSAVFHVSDSCCSAVCEACGRIHFVAGDGDASYESGRLEELLQQADKKPDKYIPVYDSSYIREGYCPATGKQIVLDCECEPVKRFCEWVEHHADDLTDYLVLFWREKNKQARRTVEQSGERALDLMVVR